MTSKFGEPPGLSRRGSTRRLLNFFFPLWPIDIPRRQRWNCRQDGGLWRGTGRSALLVGVGRRHGVWGRRQRGTRAAGCASNPADSPLTLLDLGSDET
jgi:hypothetical protein